MSDESNVSFAGNQVEILHCFKKKHTFQNHTGNQFNLDVSLYICDLQIINFMNGNSMQWKPAVLNVL